MRYTKVTTASYVVSLVLIGVAAAFAAWRSRGAPAGGGPDEPWTSGRGAYESECASCHGTAISLAGPLGESLQWEPLAELLLKGEARFVAGGTTRVARRHPTFEDASDERLAAIVNHVLASGSRLVPRMAEPADLRKARAR